ncbi:hypothetical protein WDU99_14870 [Microbacterium sp. Mu-80]|uniref:Uncharacterized protein n=1 Tax=Microbacterium bandirmense TaxID=3122050 RepID=A0ABU8LFZ8_9MICO
MHSLEQTTRTGTTRGVGVLLVGFAIALWIVFGRFLFGAGGELTVVYLAIGLIVLVLHVFIARALSRTASRGFPVRPATRGTLIAAWGCGILLGLTIPDITAKGMQTIISGAQQPALDVAIGVANPAGIIMMALTIISLVLANQDAQGPRPTEDDEF